MKFDKVRIYNFEGALRGMRNPKNSWHLSDSKFGICSWQTAPDIVKDFIKTWYEHNGIENIKDVDINERQHVFDLVDNDVIIWTDGKKYCEYASIGPKDMKLATTLINSGPEHRKFLRQIFVSVDITAPLYWY